MPQVKRIQPDFPQWKSPRSGAGFLFGVLLWILLILVFLVVAYAQFFSFNLRYLLNLIHPKTYHVPLWFSLLVSFILFPLSIGVILIGALTRIVRN